MESQQAQQARCYLASFVSPCGRVPLCTTAALGGHEPRKGTPLEEFVGCIWYGWRVTNWLSLRLLGWVTNSTNSLETHAVGAVCWNLCWVYSLPLQHELGGVKQLCLCRPQSLFPVQCRQIFCPKEALIQFRHHLLQSFPICIWIRFLNITQNPASCFE